MKKLWDTYGLQIIIAIAAILTVAVSFETFKAWRTKRAESWSDTYAVAMALQNQGRFDESMKVLKQIAETNDGIYGDIAQIQTSNILFEQGKTKKLIAILEGIINNQDINKKCAMLPLLSWLHTSFDTAPREEIEALLNPLVEEKRQLGKHCPRDERDAGYS